MASDRNKQSARYNVLNQSVDEPMEQEQVLPPPPQLASQARATLAPKNSRRETGPKDHAHKSSGNEKIYEAFNDLHTLAQVFEKPFDAPAILVCGQQTDGKSALVEALIGFQFNHVGGGTKTRRPITLHMKYNGACVQPMCWLVNDDMGEVEMTLEELQEYIELENARLEREGQFWSKEIVVKIEYKYCPNLTIIDTPGLISAAPGRGNAQLQAASRAIETMVRAKMEQKEYIILCLEDSNDWSNATTRRVVMQVDPSLARTVLVSTKFDTRIPTFSRGADVEMFLKPSCLEPCMLGGGPFFTSVPAGRVGAAAEAVFPGNEAFRAAVAEREAADVGEIEAKMGRKLDRATERAFIGVGRLRVFLEGLLQARYLENVPTIVPLLEREYRAAQARLVAVRSELANMNPPQLKEQGRAFTEGFLSRLGLVLRGHAGAPPDKFGETLADEHLHGGAFTGPGGVALTLPDGALPNAGMRLYGGAQFHRAMAEFRLAVGQIVCPDLSREEVANACGLDDAHDGANYMRAACVIAVSKAREAFEPFIHQLGTRLSHVLRRLLPPTVYLLQRDNGSGTLAGAPAVAPTSLGAGTEALLKRVSSAFTTFIDEVEGSCKGRCLEDLTSTTRYVSWSLHTKSARSLRSMLNKVKLPGGGAAPTSSSGNGKDRDKAAAAAAEAAAAGGAAGVVAELLEHTLFNRQLTATSEELVAALVAQIFEGIRDHVVQSMELKFNCFFLMPVVDTFPARLRSEMEAAYECGVEGLFDVCGARGALEGRLKALTSEVHQVEKLQRKFATIHATLAQQQASAAPSGGVPGSVSTAGAAISSSNGVPAPTAPAASPRPASPGPQVQQRPAAAGQAPATATANEEKERAPRAVQPRAAGVGAGGRGESDISQPVTGSQARGVDRDSASLTAVAAAGRAKTAVARDAGDAALVRDAGVGAAKVGSGVAVAGPQSTPSRAGAVAAAAAAFSAAVVK